MGWNERYLEGDTPWEKGKPSPVLDEIHDKIGIDIWGAGAVLVPGCGFGHDARWLAARGLRVRGLDIAEEALKGARQLSEEGLPLSFEQRNFFEAQPHAVSAIWEHTCYCAIEPSERKNYVKAAAEWLPSGAHLVGVFFLTPEDDGEGGPPHGTTVEELNEIFGPYFEVIDEWQPVSGYPERLGREWARVMRKR